ncbi:DeoR/GlpR transcriptional regulator [Phaeobacter sp. LSS9]|nr:DeoR/GlpR family DNA-binding transcription regulator [Phaeobacter sp. LSS9]AXT35964.1 DeoR/GlpR transcriptional regulator [Phaeobacter sp. LSS9]
MPADQKMSHRELELLEALRRLGGSARSGELAKVLGVSEETVRRTIKALAKQGLVQRVHGGAYLSGPDTADSFFRRISKYTEEKQSIAAGVLPQITDGMAIFLDVGSTTAFVAKELRRRANLTVVTNSIGVAQTLANHNGNRVHFLGGEIQSNERGTFGHVAEQQVRAFALDLAVLSADAFSAKHGALYHSATEAQLAAVVAQAAERTLLLLAHPKFDDMAPHRGPQPEMLDLLMTDALPGRKYRRALETWGIGLELAPTRDADAGSEVKAKKRAPSLE